MPVNARGNRTSVKKMTAMFAVFGLAAAAAAYVASFPHAAPGDSGALAALDTIAARLIGIRGRSAAVIGLLGFGIVLSLLAPLAIRDDRSVRPAKASRRPAKHTAKRDEQPGPIWRPDPLSPEERIASLRRRTAQETGREAGSETSAPVPGPLPRPVILLRKPRERARDWFDDSSWLGGLPRLGDIAWPRDAGGTPLPFAAQIDLAELAAACPESPLPKSGALAFFLGAGAVVPASSATGGFTDPPDDLAPAFEEGGDPFPAPNSRLSCHLFPFWPVAPTVLDLPVNLRNHPNANRDREIAGAMDSLIAEHALKPEQEFSVQDSAAARMLWWHSVNHLADRLHAAFNDTNGPAVLRHEGLRQTDPAAIEMQRGGLPDMIAAIDQFVTGRDPWQQLTAEEFGVVEDFVAELHTSFSDLVRHRVPDKLDELATLSLRTMVTDAPEALAAMPEDVLTRINRDYRLPPGNLHQMFGPGACRQAASDEHRRDILLLQLGYDDMMEWRWEGKGLFQFWISPENAASGNWASAHLTFKAG